jgi:hypothetical protein
MKKLLLALPLIALLAACDPPPAHQSSTEIERKKQEEMTKQGVTTVGFPAVVNFSEKRMMKDIIELRDQMKPTYTYIVDMNGRTHKLCDSLGYGLPYATQYTNPQQDTFYTTSSSQHVVLANADPNGLYSPASADGTWVMCLNPNTKRAEPQYIEPRIVTTTYPLGE